MFASSTLIVGLGESGLAMARFLAREHVCNGIVGALTVLDSRQDPPGLEVLRSQYPAIQFVSADLDSETAAGLLTQHAQLAWSPGLSPHHGASGHFYRLAVQQGKTPLGELDVFAAGLAQLKVQRGYRPRMVAITGTNGKTTTTMLTAHLLRNAGHDVVVAGNVSPAMLDVLRERLQAGILPTIWVLELSSFQLGTSQPFALDAATVLNLSQDHLDWHIDFEEYAQAKGSIYARAAVSIFNRQDKLTEPAAALAAIQAYQEARKRKPKLTAQMAAPPRVLSFGQDEPREESCFGLVQGGGVSWLAECQSLADASDKPGETVPTHVNRLMPAEAMLLRGAHNHANALAALALVKALGQRLGPVLHSLGRYQGEPHRCELVGVLKDVEYIEDSKGTNVGATVAALNGLGRNDGKRRLLLIAGGDGKGQDFNPLAIAIAQQVKTLFVIGRDGPTIAAQVRALSGESLPIVQCDSLEQAVQLASQGAATGDAVLLSPACASFDMFKNYKHRAQVFVDAVRQLGELEGNLV